MMLLFSRDVAPWALALSLFPLPAHAQGLKITEIMAATNSSGDWFEVMNTGSATINFSLTPYKIDDQSASPTLAADLLGVATLAPGEVAVFLEVGTGANDAPFATQLQNFRDFWGGPAATMKLGYYSGSGVSLSAAGDTVVLFSGNTEITRITYTTAQQDVSYAYSTANPQVQILSQVGMYGAYQSAGNTVADPYNIGSPGIYVAIPEPASMTLLTLIGAAMLLRRTERIPPLGT